MNDVETLRRAAEHLRAAYGGEHQHGIEVHFHLAVADLLANEAGLIESVIEHPDLHSPLNGARTRLLLAAARAYLGEQP